MKLAVYGRETAVKKIASTLADHEVQVIDVSKGIGGMAVDDLGGTWDMALIDSQADGADRVCSYVKRFLGIPLLLMVKRGQPYWEWCEASSPDGYILDTVMGGELVARLQAVARRAGNGGGR